MNSADIFKKYLLKLPNTYDANEVNLYINDISKLPKKMLIKLVKGKLKVRFITGLITDEPEYRYLRGTNANLDPTCPDGATWDDILGLGPNPMLIRIGHTKPMHGPYSSVILHEMGHAVDYICFYSASTSREFVELYREENKNMDAFYYDTHAEYDMKEYFAEAFSIYFYSNEGKKFFKQYAPKTYNFLDKLFLDMK